MKKERRNTARVSHSVLRTRTYTMKGERSIMWGFIYAGAFAAVFILSAIVKLTYHPMAKAFAFEWNDSTGKIYTDLSYGEGEANTFDLYVPADNTKEAYGLIVYLHAGGFTSGDKRDDAEMLKRLCSMGYVAAGINYTLFSEAHPEANVYTQSQEIKASIPFVVAEAEKLGYHLDSLAMSGGSAGHCLAMIYAYRDAASSPLPVKFVFGAVGPSCFYLEDWINLGGDPDHPAAVDPNADYGPMAELFSAMAGKTITAKSLATGAYLEEMKEISAAMWIDEHSVPTVCAYGAWDKVQAFGASRRLEELLTQYNVPHEYIVFPHSGHGLQNDSALYAVYMEKITEYLAAYMPVR